MEGLSLHIDLNFIRGRVLLSEGFIKEYENILGVMNISYSYTGIQLMFLLNLFFEESQLCVYIGVTISVPSSYRILLPQLPWGSPSTYNAKINFLAAFDATQGTRKVAVNDGRG